KRPEFDIVMWIAGCLICFLPMLKLVCHTNAGYGRGLLTGWIIERRFVKFEENGSYIERAVRFLIGGAILVFLLKSLAPWLCLFMASKYAGFFANFVISIYVMALYPFVFSKVFVSVKGLGRLWKGAIAALLVVALIMGMSAALKHRHDTETALEEVTSDEQVVEADLEVETDGSEQTVEGSLDVSETEVQDPLAVSDPGAVVIAHRGYCGEYPENTMASFNGALDIGADFIETDVQMTADGVLVLYHDDTLTRITGDEGAIADYTYEELLQKDFGSWFDTSFAGEKIPKLEELLELIAGTEDTRIYLELKDIGDVDGFTQKCYDEVSAAGLLDRVIFASFNYDYMMEIKNIDSNAKILYNTIEGRDDLPVTNPADYYGLYLETVTAATIDSIHEAGSQAYIWTVDDPYQMQSLIEMGADGICTNKAGVAILAVHSEYNFIYDNYISSVTLPGLYENGLPEANEYMVVQGFTKAGNNLVVSAYSKNGDNSILYVMDLTGRLLQYVDLQFAAHTGGIAYDETDDILWVTGAEGTVNALRWSDIKNGAYNGEILYTFDAGLVNHGGGKVASFLAYYSGELFVGSYFDGGNGKLNRYDISEPFNPVLLSQMDIPERIQGVTFADKGDGNLHMLMTQGYNVEDAHLFDFVYDENVLDYTMPAASYLLPEGAEQLLYTSKGLYIMFESAARPYRPTARIANDQIYLLRY
ncbi:MAG: hypothetical protein K6B41_01085, partial [Butyrivibrio sp.]|nr:hypothetical protein [Butyrivibrio sp.]